MNLTKTKLAFLICCALSGSISAQTSDDFSDGDFTQNPAWTGDVDLFVVAPYPLDESNLMLRSNSPGAANYYLSTENTITDEVFWSFFFNLRFATSGANYVDVYLMADNADLTAVQNGYFLRLGGTPDEISFFKVLNGTVSLLIDGEDGLVGSSSNNPFRIYMTRSAEGLWILSIDQGDNGNFISGGSITDNEISTTNYFGFRIVQASSTSFVNKHFFDEIEIAPIPIDETPPSLISAEAISATELLVLFSEPLLESSVGNTTNYNVDGGIGAPSDAIPAAGNPAGVLLTFSTPFADGTNYSLTVSGLSDLAGNVMSAASTEFFFFIPGTAGFKDIVFNELMIDPTPVVGLPEVEYIELFNASDVFLDMAGWILVNTTTERTLSPLVIPPGEFLILCNTTNVEVLEPYGEVMGIPSFVALANTADSLTLINPDGLIIDIVSYTDSWYDDPNKDDGGYAIELINPFTECSGKSNWRASEHPDGGTPGMVNSIFDDSPDVQAPEVLNFEVLSPGAVLIRFTEVMDEASLISGSYIWNEGIQTTSVSVAGGLSEIVLELEPDLQTGVEYELALSGQTDCVGNEISANTTIEIQLGEIPLFQDLLITEIMADPTPTVGLPEAEYFELYNASEKVLDIQGITLSNLQFSTPKLLAPGEYLLCVGATSAEAFEFYPDKYVIEGMSTTFLTNGGRELLLFNQEGELLDRIAYDLTWYNDEDKIDGGYSLERINLDEPCRGADNWTASVAANGGTPGEPNSVYDDTPDATRPEVRSVFVISPTEIEIRFSEVIDSLSAMLADISITPNVQILENANVPPAYMGIRLELGEPLQDGVQYTLLVNGILDCTGNEIEENDPFPFGLPQPGLPGDIIINEVLFNPRTGGAMFVEVVNVSDKIIGLQEWALQNGDFTTRVISTDPEVIFPDQYLVFTSSINNIRQEYPLGRHENYLEMESLPSYTNSGGSVILADHELNIVDRFDYLEDYHLSLLNDVKGVSLERMSFTRPTNDPGNWTSAAQNVGFATPGYRNSQYNPEGRASSTFELQSEVFSPDNDGFEDIMQLNYVLDMPGSLATIRIYDRRGRIVKELANNLVLGTEGTITWDGVADNGTKARIGVHIILIEVFDLSGRTEAFKIPCIVAGRLSD